MRFDEPPIVVLATIGQQPGSTQQGHGLDLGPQRQPGAMPNWSAERRVMRASSGVPPASRRTSTWAGVSAAASASTRAGSRLVMLLPSARVSARLTSRACAKARALAERFRPLRHQHLAAREGQAGRVVGVVVFGHVDSTTTPASSPRAVGRSVVQGFRAGRRRLPPGPGRATPRDRPAAPLRPANG